MGQACPACASIVGRSVDIALLKLPPETVHAVSGAFAREYCVLPLSVSPTGIVFATCYPHSEPMLIEKLRYVMGKSISLHYCDRRELFSAIEQYLPDASEPEILIV